MERYEIESRDPYYMNSQWYEALNREQRRVQGQLSELLEVISEMQKAAAAEDKSYSALELIANGYASGYYNAARGQEGFKAMCGLANEVDKYNELLSAEEYSFEPETWWEKMLYGSSQQIGQLVRQTTDPDTMALAMGSGGAAFWAGQTGPQIAFPEEVLTVPAAITLAMKAGNAKTTMEIESGLAYLEMLDKGVSERTARAIASGIGGFSAALDTIQLDEIIKAYKILDKTGADSSLLDFLLRELKRWGINVGVETGLELLQDSASITGVQIGSKIDTGEWAYTSDYVKDRLWDTAKNSALTFGLTNSLSAGHNVAVQSHNHLVGTENIGQVIAPSDRHKIDNWAYTPTDEQYLKYKKVYDNPKYYNQETGAVIWPENHGFVGKQSSKVLQPGTRIDRYGSDFGSFVSPEGTPYNMRAVAPGTDMMQYSVFEVVKPLTVTAGKAMPWFDEIGGGIQYLLPETVDALLDAGIIRRIQ